FLEYRHARPNDKQKGQWVEERRLAAFVLRRDEPVLRLELGATDKLAADLAKWNPGGTTALTAERLEAALRLREQLWKPLEKLIQEDDRVLVCGDGLTARLPFAALPAAASGTKRYLIEAHAIGFLPSARLLPEMARARPAAHSGTLLMVGDVEYGTGTRKPPFTRLRGTAQELKTIEQLWDTDRKDRRVRLLRGGGASRTAPRA